MIDTKKMTEDDEIVVWNCFENLGWGCNKILRSSLALFSLAYPNPTHFCPGHLVPQPFDSRNLQFRCSGVLRDTRHRSLLVSDMSTYLVITIQQKMNNRGQCRVEINASQRVVLRKAHGPKDPLIGLGSTYVNEICKNPARVNVTARK